ncbi:MAG: hypothetical protein RR922_00185 [Clostridia bacterium]
MNNLLNSKLVDMLSGIDKNKLNQLNRILTNLSKDDLNNIVQLLEKSSSNDSHQEATSNN